MGRPRKPTAIKQLQGTSQKCRENPLEPVPAVGRPEMPQNLTVRARGLWPGVCDLIEGMGVLTVADRPALHGLCEAYADMIESRERCQNGEDGHGRYSDADRRFLAYLRVFGLTPADRSKVSAIEKPKKNKFAEVVEISRTGA